MTIKVNSLSPSANIMNQHAHILYMFGTPHFLYVFDCSLLFQCSTFDLLGLDSQVWSSIYLAKQRAHQFITISDLHIAALIVRSWSAFLRRNLKLVAKLRLIAVNSRA